MKRFIDSKGRTWPILVTTSTIARIRAAIGIDLIAIASFSMDEVAKLSDPLALADIAWEVVQAEAEKQNVDKTDFIDSISGDVIDELHQALTSSLLAYFPESKRRLAEAAITSLREMTGEAEAQAMKAIPLAMAEAIEQLSRQTSSGKSTVSPESVESTPAP